jgi:tetratricopeptide (TPR) repeat protein
MKFVSTTAFVLTAAAAVAQPALAQKPAAPQAQPAARKYNLSPEARKPLTDLQSAVNKKDDAGYATALPAAQAAVKTADDKYILAKLTLQHAEQTNDAAARIAAYQAVLASGGADATEAQLITHNISILAGAAANWPLVESTLDPVVAANPNDVDNLVNLARAKIELKKNAEALPLLLRAIQLTEAAGKAAPETWYSSGLSLAYQTRNQAVVAQMNAALLKSYPNRQNLSNAILLYNSRAELPKDVQLDLFRLMYASGGMNTPGEYLQLAEMLETSGLPGEEQKVLESGIRAGKLAGNASAQQMLQRSGARVNEDRTSLPTVEQRARAAATGTLALSSADAYASYGDYAKAVDLYRVALQKGGVDPNVVNTRLGIALALAGRKPDAEAAFHAVSGPRVQLAGLWLTWLSQRS